MPPKRKSTQTTAKSDNGSVVKKAKTTHAATGAMPAPTSAPSGPKPADKETLPTRSNPAPAPTVPATPLAGKFDLYWMPLPFLVKLWKENKDNRYEAVLKKLVKLQKVPDRSAKILLAPPGATGRLETRAICDPFEEMPFDIAITGLSNKADVALSPSKDFLSDKPLSTGGITASLALTEDTCIVSSASGTIKMRGPVWISKDGVAVFEGTVEFNVTYSGLAARKGFGSGKRTSLPFWAIRAVKDKDGKEIGLEGWAVPPTLAYSAARTVQFASGGCGSRSYGGWPDFDDEDEDELDAEDRTARRIYRNDPGGYRDYLCERGFDGDSDEFAERFEEDCGGYNSDDWY